MKVGSFSLPTTTGTFSVSGIGFKPSVVMFRGNNETTDGQTNGNTRMAAGWITTSGQWAQAFCGKDTLWYSIGIKDPDCCILYAYPDAVWYDTYVTEFEATYSGMDNDGFTLDVLTADGTSRVMNYIAFSEDEVLGTATGEFPTFYDTGYIDYESSPPLAGDLFFIETAGIPDPYSPTLGQGLNALVFVNWCTGWGARNSETIAGYLGTAGITQQHISFSTDYLANPLAYRGARTNAILRQHGTNTQIYTIAQYVPRNAGYGLNWQNVNVPDMYVPYLSIRGIEGKAAAFNMQLAGDYTITGIGFKPEAILFYSHGRTATLAPQSNIRHSFGATDGTNSWAIWFMVNGGIAGPLNKEILNTSGVLEMTEGTGSKTQVVLKSFDPDGFTLTAVSSDSTPRVVMALCLRNRPKGKTMAPIFGHFG